MRLFFANTDLLLCGYYNLVDISLINHLLIESDTPLVR